MEDGAMSSFRRRLYKGLAQTDYIQDGLILSLDATRNTGSGFSEDADYWKDLSGNGNDARILNPGAGMWNGAAFNARDFKCYIESEMLNVEDVTMQIVTNYGGLNIQTGESGIRFSGSYGMELDGMGGSNTRIAFISKNGRFFANNGTWYDNGDNLYLATLRCSKIYAISDAYFGKNLFGIFSSSYVDKSGFRGGLWLPNQQIYGQPYSICSFRIYNRILTPEEIAFNYEIEKKKFKIM